MTGQQLETRREVSLGPAPEVVTTRLISPAARAGLDLKVLGEAPAPEGEFTWQADSGRWWVFNDHKADPTAAQYGGVVVPADVQERLVQLLRNGFAPDMILVGHEMSEDWSPGEKLPDLVPSTTRRLPDRQAQMRGVPAITSRDVGVGALEVGKAAVVASMAVGVALGAVAGALMRAASELDPVIVAGVQIPGTDVLCWVEVDRWSW